MSRERPVNVAASVRQRLLDLARRQNLRMQDVLVRFATERLLYRLAESPHRDAYVLKGAMLFTVWTGILPRATKDADLMGGGPARARERPAQGLFRPPDPRRLADAVGATFDRRGTAIPTGVPPGLSDAFADDDRSRQWEVFLDRVLAPGVERPSLGAVVATVREFLVPVTVLARSRRPD